MQPYKGVQHNSYQASHGLTRNVWITDPEIPDPPNLPEPLGFTILVRPYPITTNQENCSIIMPGEEMDFLNHITNIGRVIAVGPCCWNRAEHRLPDGTYQPWVKPGDFISFPKNVGTKKLYKGVSYMTLVDDEINERLPDPQVFDHEKGFYKINIPKSHLEKFNTIYKKESV